MKFRYICENVWLPVRDCDKIFLSMMERADLKLDYTKGTERDRQWVISQFMPVAETMVDVFFDGGVLGAEFANYFATHPVPKTEKKIRVMRRLLQFNIAHLITRGAGTAEEYRSLENGIMYSVTRLANRQRANRCVTLDDNGTVVRYPRAGKAEGKLLVNPKAGSRAPTAFLRFFDELDNEDDLFIQTFVDNPKITSDPAFLKSVETLKPRGGKRKQPISEGGQGDSDEEAEAVKVVKKAKKNEGGEASAPAKHTWTRKSAKGFKHKVRKSAPLEPIPSLVVGHEVTATDKKVMKKIEVEVSSKKKHLDRLHDARKGVKTFKAGKASKSSGTADEEGAPKKPKPSKNMKLSVRAVPKTSGKGKGGKKPKKQKPPSSEEEEEEEDDEDDEESEDDAPPPPKTIKTRNAKK